MKKTLFVLALLFANTAIAGLDIELRAGSPDSISSSADNDTTKVLLKGGLVFQPISSGPAFGTGLCGIAYRTTGETNMDPSLVHRCVTYTWETYDSGTGGIPWAANLTSRGLLVGGHVGDSLAYPTARLDVRARGTGGSDQNTANFIHADGSHTTIRIGTTSNSLAGCIIFDVAGEPVAAFGRCGALFSRTGSELNYGKFVSGSWSYVGTLMSW